MKRTSSPFKWRHYAPDVILLCVRMMRKGQLKRIGGKDALEQVKFVEGLFGVAA